MKINLQVVIQFILLIIFTMTTTLGMVLIASYPTYQIALPWQPEQKIQASSQVVFYLLLAALLSATLYYELRTRT